MQKCDQNNEQHVAYMSQSLTDDEIKYSMSLRMFFPGPMRIFVVLILVLSNMLFQLRKKQNWLGKNKDLLIPRLKLP
jgi:hypothetical protein